LERRVRETMVIASAYMLGASDGKLRFGSAILHQRILWWRNVDIQIREGFEAATTGWNGIALYQGHMNDPINAGREVLHEWAHWEFNLPNEHKGVDTTQLSHLAQAIDANSIMGARASGEFCTARNHWWGAHCGKDESNWSQIAAQYGCNVDDQQSGNVYQGRYLDVLNQLEELFDLTIDE